MNEINIIRGSEFQDFLRCRRRWNWRWNEGLRAKQLNDKLFTGSLIHKFLEVYYESNNVLTAEKAMKDMFLEADTQYSDQLELRDLWDLAIHIALNYVNNWGETDSQYKTIATEVKFMIKLDAEIAFTGTIDWIFEDEEGRIWFADHKTTSSIDKYEKNSLMDRQISRYWWALNTLANNPNAGGIWNEETQTWVRFNEILGKEIYGFTYNVILKDVPKKPELLKKGGLSKAKNQKTTFELYMEAINENELNLSDYNDILTHLQLQGNRYFKRVDVIRGDQELESAMYEFLYAAEDIAGLKSGLELEKINMLPPNDRLTLPSNKLYRNITSDCQWDCEFKALCQAEIEGSNTSFLRAASYEKGE